MHPEASNVLILGGTAEARSLAHTLVAAGVDVESSLAGRVSNPRLPAGRVRIGGFGGVEGLVSYLQERRFTHLIDATHPFAAQMSQHAAVAADRCQQIAVLRFVRPGWADHPDAATWQWVPDLAAAAAATAQAGRRPFLTTGRQSLPSFADLPAEHILARVVDPMAPPGPAWSVVHDRGPYEVAAEIYLMQHHGVDVVVTKDSGGDYTSAKLSAAASLRIPVVVVSRPRPTLPGSVQHGGVATAHRVADVLAWLEE